MNHSPKEKIFAIPRRRISPNFFVHFDNATLAKRVFVCVGDHGVMEAFRPPQTVL